MRSSTTELKDRFSSRVNAIPVAGGEVRAQIARGIRECRESLVALLGIPEEIAGCGDWSIVQKEIHARIRSLDRGTGRSEAQALEERLLDMEEELIEGNLRFVLMVVRRYARGSMGAMEEMDFVQEGCEGLLDAVRRFDFSGSGGFLTYAMLRIRRRILLAMERQQRLVRVPAHALRKGFYVKEVITDFCNRTGRYPTPSEIERETGGSIDWSIIMNLTENVLPLHHTGNGSGIPLEERIPSEARTEDRELGSAVEAALQRLDERSRFVLVMRYGLMDGEPHGLADIGRILGISYERTRQIEKASIAVLAEYFSGFSASDWLRED